MLLGELGPGTSGSRESLGGGGRGGGAHTEKTNAAQVQGETDAGKEKSNLPRKSLK